MIEVQTVGLVLAGGRSSRFGAEKAVQVLAGRTLLEWAHGALAAVCGEVAVSAAPGSDAAALAAAQGWAVLADDDGHASGPLAGIAAGLAWAATAGAAQLVTLPCDTPGVGADILSRLLDESGGAFAATADGPHALCAVWPVAALPALTASLSGGGHPAVRDALKVAGAKPVIFAEARPFANVNTPLDLAALAATRSRP